MIAIIGIARSSVNCTIMAVVKETSSSVEGLRCFCLVAVTILSCTCMHVGVHSFLPFDVLGRHRFDDRRSECWNT